MLDLETLGKHPGCVVAAIGAVQFDPATRAIGQTFYMAIDIEDAQRAGLWIDGDTTRWWMRQDDAARAVFNDPGAQPLDLALNMFAASARCAP